MATLAPSFLIGSSSFLKVSKKVNSLFNEGNPIGKTNLPGDPL